MHICITGTGIAIPGRSDTTDLAGHIVTNDVIGGLVGYEVADVVRKTGIHRRHYAAENVSTTDLAVHAARQAIADASIDPSSIDHIYFMSMSPDIWSPMAEDFQYRLGASNAAVTPINVGCAGFAWAMRQAYGLMQTGDETVLIVCAERMSGIIDVGSSDKTQMVFGDAAGAVVLETLTAGYGMSTQHGRLLPKFYLRTESKEYRQIHQPRDRHLRMDTPALVARWANRTVPAAIRDYCAQAGISLTEVDHLILHQANLRIIEAVRASLGLPEDKVPTNIAEIGNTSAASIPILLHQMSKTGRLQPDQLIVCVGFGAGLNIGICAFRWYNPT